MEIGMFDKKNILEKDSMITSFCPTTFPNLFSSFSSVFYCLPTFLCTLSSSHGIAWYNRSTARGDGARVDCCGTGGNDIR